MIMASSSRIRNRKTSASGEEEEEESREDDKKVKRHSILAGAGFSLEDIKSMSVKEQSECIRSVSKSMDADDENIEVDNDSDIFTAEDVDIVADNTSNNVIENSQEPSGSVARIFEVSITPVRTNKEKIVTSPFSNDESSNDTINVSDDDERRDPREIKARQEYKLALKTNAFIFEPYGEINFYDKILKEKREKALRQNQHIISFYYDKNSEFPRSAHRRFIREDLIKNSKLMKDRFSPKKRLSFMDSSYTLPWGGKPAEVKVENKKQENKFFKSNTTRTKLTLSRTSTPDLVTPEPDEETNIEMEVAEEDVVESKAVVYVSKEDKDDSDFKLGARRKNTAIRGGKSRGGGRKKSKNQTVLSYGIISPKTEEPKIVQRRNVTTGSDTSHEKPHIALDLHSCPICHDEFSADVIEAHASTCIKFEVPDERNKRDFCCEKCNFKCGSPGSLEFHNLMVCGKKTPAKREDEEEGSSSQTQDESSGPPIKRNRRKLQLNK